MSGEVWGRGAVRARSVDGFIGACFLGSCVDGAVDGSWRCSCRDRVLARTATRPLAGYDDTLDEQLATPDAPGLAAVLRAGEAGLDQRAGPAQGLGVLDVGRGLGEEDLRVVGTAGDGYAEVLDGVVERGERGERGQGGVLREAGRGDRVGRRYGRGVRFELHGGVFLVCRPACGRCRGTGLCPRLRSVSRWKTKGPRIPVWGSAALKAPA